jgi:hypothetical protein
MVRIYIKWDNVFNESTAFGNLLLLFFVVLGLELRAFTLSCSTSPIFVMGFLRQGLANYLPGLALNRDPPDLCHWCWVENYKVSQVIQNMILGILAILQTVLYKY